ncbi:MAG: hypothetical protein H0V93_13230, partial [Euzebyales bacterium]|nr:hypothetical protein [Euzebyales bacterium]
ELIESLDAPLPLRGLGVGDPESGSKLAERVGEPRKVLPLRVGDHIEILRGAGEAM